MLVRGLQPLSTSMMRAMASACLQSFRWRAVLITGKYKRQRQAAGTARELTVNERLADTLTMTDANGRVVVERFRNSAMRAGPHGRTMLELAFSWMLARPDGGERDAGATKSPSKLEQNVRARDWVLTPTR